MRLDTPIVVGIVRNTGCILALLLPWRGYDAILYGPGDGLMPIRNVQARARQHLY